MLGSDLLTGLHNTHNTQPTVFSRTWSTFPIPQVLHKYIPAHNFIASNSNSRIHVSFKFTSIKKKNNHPLPAQNPPIKPISRLKIKHCTRPNNSQRIHRHGNRRTKLSARTCSTHRERKQNGRETHAWRERASRLTVGRHLGRLRAYDDDEDPSRLMLPLRAGSSAADELGAAAAAGYHPRCSADSTCSQAVASIHTPSVTPRRCSCASSPPDSEITDLDAGCKFYARAARRALLRCSCRITRAFVRDTRGAPRLMMVEGGNCGVGGYFVAGFWWWVFGLIGGSRVEGWCHGSGYWCVSFVPKVRRLRGFEAFVWCTKDVCRYFKKISNWTDSQIE